MKRYSVLNAGFSFPPQRLSKSPLPHLFFFLFVVVVVVIGRPFVLVRLPPPGNSRNATTVYTTLWREVDLEAILELICTSNCRRISNSSPEIRSSRSSSYVFISPFFLPHLLPPCEVERCCCCCCCWLYSSRISEYISCSLVHSWRRTFDAVISIGL